MPRKDNYLAERAHNSFARWYRRVNKEYKTVGGNVPIIIHEEYLVNGFREEWELAYRLKYDRPPGSAVYYGSLLSFASMMNNNRRMDIIRKAVDSKYSFCEGIAAVHLLYTPSYRIPGASESHSIAFSDFETLGEALTTTMMNDPGESSDTAVTVYLKNYNLCVRKVYGDDLIETTVLRKWKDTTTKAEVARVVTAFRNGISGAWGWFHFFTEQIGDEWAKKELKPQHDAKEPDSASGKSDNEVAGGEGTEQVRIISSAEDNQTMALIVADKT